MFRNMLFGCTLQHFFTQLLAIILLHFSFQNQQLKKEKKKKNKLGRISLYGTLNMTKYFCGCSVIELRNCITAFTTCMKTVHIRFCISPLKTKPFAAHRNFNLWGRFCWTAEKGYHLLLSAKVQIKEFPWVLLLEWWLCFVVLFLIYGFENLV